MMTQEQKNFITNFLVSKNFSIDILIEVRDHFIIQIESLQHDENLSFDDAFDITKGSWEKDLRMVYRIAVPLRKISVFQRNIERKINQNILKKSLLSFSCLFVFGLILTVLNKNFASKFLLTLDIVLVVITAFSAIRYFKTWWSSSYYEKRKISIYQRGSVMFVLSGFYILNYNFINFDSRFEKYYQSIVQIFTEKTIGYEGVFNITMIYVFVFFWILGFNYFVKYRKIVNNLKSQIGLKL